MVETERRGSLDMSAAPAHFLVVQAPYYAEIGAMLLEGTTRALRAAGATFDLVDVPGSLEIPVALSICLDGGSAEHGPYAGAIALGCIVRGETYHFDIVANESARGVMQIGIDRALPVGNAILTVETLAQAEVRADPRRGDKGGEAALAAVTLWRLKQDAAR